jgi:drug/metabolite transporter (DMT)-like permease
MVAEGASTDHRGALACHTARSMVAIVGGLGAALSWAIATLASSRSSRMIGAMSVLGWVMAVGLVVAIVPAFLAQPVPLGLPQVAGLVLLGLCHNIGLLLVYRALTIGRVSIVAPIAATEGALAALLSVALGESLALTTGVLLVAIAVGVVLAAAERPPDAGATRSFDPAANRRAALLALAAAATFSVGLVLSGRFGASGMSPAWVIVATRTVGITIIVLPLVLTRRLRLTRPAVPLVLLAGVLEAVGSAVYVIAASQGVAVAAVLSSQFAAIAALGGFVLFGERIQRHQLLGVVLIALGVTALAATQV